MIKQFELTITFDKYNSKHFDKLIESNLIPDITCANIDSDIVQVNYDAIPLIWCAQILDILIDKGISILSFSIDDKDNIIK